MAHATPPDRKQWRGTLAYLVLMSFVISALAFMNRYPLMYTDSGTYMHASFTLVPHPDRPIGYSLIIRALTWQSTMWTVVLFQGFSLGWLLFEVLRKVLPTGTSIMKAHVITVAALLLFTSMPWYAAQIMPDILTPMLLMVVYLLFRAPELSLVKKIVLWLFFFFFLISHSAHVAMMALLLVGMVLARLTSRSVVVKGFWRVWGIGATLLIVGVAFVSGYNARHGLPATFSPTANVYLSGRLCEGEILHDYLEERCPTLDHAICPYRDELPNLPASFMWGENSIVARMGMDLVQADSALAPVVRDLLSTPSYLARYVRGNITATAVQLFQVNANSGIDAYSVGSAPYHAIHSKLPAEEHAFLTSYQAMGQWVDMRTIDRVVHVTLFLSVFVLLLTWKEPTIPGELRHFAVGALLWIFLNAMVTASLANVYDRLQSRVAWLLVLVALLFLFSARGGWLNPRVTPERGD